MSLHAAARSGRVRDGVLVRVSPSASAVTAASTAVAAVDATPTAPLRFDLMLGPPRDKFGTLARLHPPRSVAVPPDGPFAPIDPDEARTRGGYQAGDRIDIQKTQRTVEDVNLVVLQVCRASLLVAALVAAISSIGPSVDNYLRVACAAASAACILSVRFYTRLLTLRRLPNGIGYRLEGNAVAEAMRVANWTVVVGLLTWSSFFLRGPYEADDTHVGLLLVRLTYDQWRTWGAMMMALTSLIAIPIWHIATVVQSSAHNCVFRVVCALAAVLLLLLSLVLSSDVFQAIVDDSRLCLDARTGMAINGSTPDDDVRCARRDDEFRFARFSSYFWIGYSLVAVVRAVAGSWHACVATLHSLGRDHGRRAMDSDATSQPHKGRDWCGSTMGMVGSASKHLYLVMVSVSMQVHDTESMKRMAAWSDLGWIPTGNGSESDAAETAPLIRRAPSEQPVPGSLSTHDAAVSHICTQILDTLLAVLDVVTQAIVAFGYASLTVPDRTESATAFVRSGGLSDWSRSQ